MNTTIVHIHGIPNGKVKNVCQIEYKLKPRKCKIY